MPYLSEERKQRLIEIGAGLLIGFLFFLLSFSIPYQRLELLSLDARFNLRPRIKVNRDVATIDIDDTALKEEGRWQDWTRDKHARLFDAVRKGGGALIGVDIYFSEESERVARFQDITHASSLEDVFGVIRDYDGELAQAAKQAANIYWGATFVLAEDTKKDLDPAVSADYSPFSPEVLDLLVRKGCCIPAGGWEACDLPRAISPQAFPITRLIDVARGVGIAQIVREADGVVRKYPTFFRYEPPDGKSASYLFPSMGLAMACDYLQVPLKNLRMKAGEYLEIPNAYMPDGSRKTLRIPVDARGEMIINWAGDYNETFRHFPYTAVMRLAEQRNLEDIKRFVVSLDPSVFENPGDLIRTVVAAFPDTDDALKYVACLYGAHYYESRIQAGDDKFSPALFEQLFGLSPSDNPDLYQTQTEVFENVRSHLRMLKVLSADPDLSPKEAISAAGLDDSSALGIYRRIRRLLKFGGPQPSDRPLFFLEPVTVDGSEVWMDSFRGGVFFYGLTASGTHDLNPMPFNPRYPMVGAIANVFNTIVTDQFITPLRAGWKLPIFLLIGLFTGYILSTRTTIRGSLFTILFLVAFLLFAYWLFASRRIWIDVIGPAGTILISDAVIVWYKFNTAEKKRRFIKGAFEHYLNPAVVAEIAKNPDMLELGGKEMELTAFFSDVAGFTTISEQLSAHELVELLNQYLTAMTDILLGYNGHLDKYEGDAIMGVFGAPIHYADHAAKACFVALEMQARLNEMRVRWKAEGMPELCARIGINSGPMVVGNMGSKDVFNYTVMGDAVNLASRLEGVNKQYGTNIMISEFTYALCKDDVLVREIDLIRVKGKAKPVSIYEVLARTNGSLPEDLAQTVDCFARGLAAYREKRWENAIEFFQEALAVRPDDGPSLTYLKRCRDYASAPPPDDWDGVFIMKSK